MSDWTQFEYERILGVYAEEEMFGPLTTIDRAHPIVDPNRVKLDVLNYNSSHMDWRLETNEDKDE